MKSSQTGYGALLFVILTGASLLTFLLFSNEKYFQFQERLRKYMYKEQSYLLAKSCLNIATVQLAENPRVLISESKIISIRSHQCAIESILELSMSGSGMDRQVLKKATVYGEDHWEHTRLEATVLITNFEVEVQETQELFS